MHTKTIEELRIFLRLCLDPGPGRSKRTIDQLAALMPDWLAVEIAAHSVHVPELRRNAHDASAEYTEALRAWISEQTDQESETVR